MPEGEALERRIGGDEALEAAGEEKDVECEEYMGGEGAGEEARDEEGQEDAGGEKGAWEAEEGKTAAAGEEKAETEKDERYFDSDAASAVVLQVVAIRLVVKSLGAGSSVGPRPAAPVALERSQPAEFARSQRRLLGRGGHVAATEFPSSLQIESVGAQVERQAERYEGWTGQRHAEEPGEAEEEPWYPVQGPQGLEEEHEEAAAGAAPSG
ncbi:hypothetical protein V8C26DRAFT_430114 [Trichoderma gracile]